MTGFIYKQIFTFCPSAFHTLMLLKACYTATEGEVTAVDNNPAYRSLSVFILYICFTDISLTKLQVVFPDDPIQLQVFLSVLRIAQSLQHLHLSWTSNQGFGTLLLTLIGKYEGNYALGTI